MLKLTLPLLALLATAGLIRLFIPMAGRIGLLAYPGGYRQHHCATPVVGGVGMMLVIALMVWGFMPAEQPIVLPLLTLTLLGVIDDRSQLPSWLRLVSQVLIVYWLIISADVQLISLGNVFGDAPMLTSDYQQAITVFAAVGVINAINMSDGLDGLAGGLTLLTCAALLFFGGGPLDFLLVFAAVVIGFLVWNIPRRGRAARTFMGDAGSTTLGLILFYLLVSNSQNPGQTILPVTALWIIALPLIDTVALLLVRPLTGSSPFAADRLHYHHSLQDMGLSKPATLLAALSIQFIFILVGMLMANYGVAEQVQLNLFLSLFGFYLFATLVRARALKQASVQHNGHRVC